MTLIKIPRYNHVTAATLGMELTVLFSWSKHVSEPEISRWSSSVITISITMFQKRLIIWQRTRHAIHIAHCTVYTVFSVLCTAQMYTSVYSVHCTVYILHILNYTLHCREGGKEDWDERNEEMKWRLEDGKRHCNSRINTVHVRVRLALYFYFWRLLACESLSSTQVALYDLIVTVLISPPHRLLVPWSWAVRHIF